jgi:glycosyltransferase involved in cell wall biosynthesis
MVAGTGPELEKLRMLAAKLKADVTFLGYLAGEKMHEAVRRARAVVLPSEWYENAPMSVLEGYALGKPVIGARIGGIPELILENETGVSFVSSKEASLVAALRDMAERSDAQVEDMGKSARAWVEQEFTALVYQERILETYRELGVDARRLVSQAPAMD